MIRHLIVFALSLFLIGPAVAAGGAVELTKRDWSFNGPFGTFDKAAMQRGFQVYREVCAGCHSMKYIAFRNFADLGYNETCLLYTSPSPRDATLSRMPSSA